MWLVFVGYSVAGCFLLVFVDFVGCWWLFCFCSFHLNLMDVFWMCSWFVFSLGLLGILPALSVFLCGVAVLTQARPLQVPFFATWTWCKLLGRIQKKWFHSSEGERDKSYSWLKLAREDFTKRDFGPSSGPPQSFQERLALEILGEYVGKFSRTGSYTPSM